MTLGSETAAVLLQAMVTLNLLMSPAQHALHSADERKAALHQLTVTVEAAAKLAETVYLDAQRVQRTARGHVSPETIVKNMIESSCRKAAAEAETAKDVTQVVRKVGVEEAWWSAVVVGERAGTMLNQEAKQERESESEPGHLGEYDVEKLALRIDILRDEEVGVGAVLEQDTVSALVSESVPVSEGLGDDDLEEMMEQAEIMMEVLGGMTVGRLDEEAQARGSSPETAGLMRDVRRLVEEVEIAQREKQRVAVDAERAGKDFDRSMQETESLRADLQRVRSENGLIDPDTEWLRSELERVRGQTLEAGRSVAEKERLVWDIKRIEGRIKRSTANEGVRAQVESLLKVYDTSVDETERLREKVDRAGNGQAKIEAETKRLRAEVDRIRSYLNSTQTVLGGGSFIV
ncbi:hypothetical protein DFP73DRAFT_588799 [Morchella snyderi]|nr:hypothetical protein DFP73DRAFT_588799 [Morchella snyderi]